MVGRSHRGEADRPGPRSGGNDVRLVELGIYGFHRDYSSSSGCLAYYLRQLGFLGAKMFIDSSFRYPVIKTKMLLNMTLPLERIVTERTMILMSLCAFFDMASQGRRPDEGLTTGAKVGCVPDLDGMFL